MKSFVLAAIALTASIVAHAQPAVDRNGLLASKDGRTLYTFDKDSPGVSHCTGGCLAAWPAFTVADPTAAGGEFSIIVRSDGTRQWAHKGRPLYFFAGDARPGDANGDKQGGVWHVIRTGGRTAGRDGAPSSGYGYSYGGN